MTVSNTTTSVERTLEGAPMDLGPDKLCFQTAELLVGAKEVAIHVIHSDWALRVADCLERIGCVVHEVCTVLADFFRQLHEILQGIAEFYPRPEARVDLDYAHCPSPERESIEGCEGRKRARSKKSSKKSSKLKKSKKSKKLKKTFTSVLGDSKIEGRNSQPPMDPQIVELRSWGYDRMATELLEQKGEDWDAIRTLSSASLIESMCELKHLLAAHSSTISSETANKVFRYAFEMADTLTPRRPRHPDSILPNLSFVPRRLVKEMATTLGKLICVVDQKPDLVASLVDPESPVKTREGIQQAFDDLMKRRREALKAHAKAHKRSLTQQSDRATATRLPVEIASLLLTQTGYVNGGIVAALSEHFELNDSHPINHYANLSYAMQMLARSVRLRDQLLEITEPQAQCTTAPMVIRTMLQLEAQEQIGAREARLCALAGILSHLRQGSVGSCFATFLGIQLMSGHLDLCLKDWKEMLAQGTLSRQVGDATMSFPYLLRMSTDNIRKKFTVNAAGKIQHSWKDTGFFWESPGLQAACRAMGIKDGEAALRSALAELFKAAGGEPSELETSPKQLIEQLGKQAATESINARQQFLMGAFAFEGETSCPLLRVWENSIAAMPEADALGSVKGQAIASTSRAIYCELRDATDCPEAGRVDFFANFVDKIEERMHLHYDPDVPHRDVATDGHSTEGAFVLYDKGLGLHPDAWKRCDSPATYQAFTLAVLEGTWQTYCEESTDSEIDALRPGVEYLKGYIQSENFVRDALFHYDLMNMLESDPFDDYSALSHTPWVDKCGNNTQRTLRIYLELSKTPKHQNSKPTSAQDLLTRVIHFARKAPDEMKVRLERNPNQLLPVRTRGQHAFNLIPGHPDLRDAWLSDEDPAHWIHTAIVEPGLQVAGSKLPVETREKIIDYCARYILASSRREQFKDKAKDIPDGLTVHEFRRNLVNLIDDIEGPYLSKRDYSIRKVDSRLVEYLPDNLRSILTDSAVHFADSNWNDGVQDLHFCFVLNPGSKQLEFWQVQADREELWAMDQERWMLDRRWEFFTDYSMIPDTQLTGRIPVKA